MTQKRGLDWTLYWENMGKAAGYFLKLPEEKLSIILVT